MKPALSAVPITNFTLRWRATGKMFLSASAWSISEYCEASRHTSGSASCMTRRMGSGAFTPMPQPLMIPSSRILDKAGKAPSSAISNCSCQEVGSSLLSGERSCTNAMSSRLTPMRCKLTPHAVRRVVEYDVVGRRGERKVRLSVVVRRRLEQLAHLGGQDVLVAVLIVEEVAVPPFREP